MKTLFVLAGILVVAFAAPHSEEWQRFKEAHGKQYKDEVEESFRMKIFKENKASIDKHNARYEKGLVSFKMGINQYSDLLSHELVEARNGLKMSLRSTVPRANIRTPVLSDLPDSIDWREKGAVTPVKNQGQCGSCWSFSTTGSLEGQLFRKTGKLVSLSEQNLVDCSYENDGCAGGLMDPAFQYIKENGGIDTEESYPYEEVDWNGCRYTQRTVGGHDTGYSDIMSGDEDALKEAVANVGPISIAMDAGLDSFQAYSGGIYYDKDCRNGLDDLDHGVLVVGYGTEDGQDYWLVKNSWGEEWGERGFFKLARNKDNHCGVATKASYPTV